jgi:hypothetical protein
VVDAENAAVHEKYGRLGFPKSLRLVTAPT